MNEELYEIIKEAGDLAMRSEPRTACILYGLLSCLLYEQETGDETYLESLSVATLKASTRGVRAVGKQQGD